MYGVKLVFTLQNLIPQAGARGVLWQELLPRPLISHGAVWLRSPCADSLGGGLRLCISNKLPGNAEMESMGHTWGIKIIERGIPQWPCRISRYGAMDLESESWLYDHR